MERWTAYYLTPSGREQPLITVYADSEQCAKEVVEQALGTNPQRREMRLPWRKQGRLVRRAE